MPKIHIKMSDKDSQELRSLVISHNRNRVDEREFDEFVNRMMKETFEISTKISVLLKEN
jgi:hypothetical protein